MNLTQNLNPASRFFLAKFETTSLLLSDNILKVFSCQIYSAVSRPPKEIKSKLCLSFDDGFVDDFVDDFVVDFVVDFEVDFVVCYFL